MKFSLKQKIILAVGATVFVIAGTVAILWWYQLLFFGDTLVRYIPSETIVYTHLNTHNEFLSGFEWYYQNIDSKIFSGTDFYFEKDVLPYVTEGSFFVFIDPVTQKEIPALMVKVKRTPEGKAQIASFIHNDILTKKRLRRNVWIFMKHPDLVEKIRWGGNRSFGSHLEEMNGGHYFTFFLHRNWLIKNLSQFFENSPLSEISSITDLHMSRWQPFLYGAIGIRNGKLITRFSDFGRGRNRLSQSASFVPLSDFLLYYEASNLAQTLKELDLGLNSHILLASDRMGVFLSKDHHFVFHFFITEDTEITESTEEEFKKELSELLSQFVNGRRKLVLPDGDVFYEIVKDPAIFSFREEESKALKAMGLQVLWRISVEGKNMEFYVAKNDREVFLAQKKEDIAAASKNLTERTQLPAYCDISQAFEFLEIKKDILPSKIQSFFHDSVYLLTRPNSRGFFLQGCQM